jgi:hypothetical protein
MRVDDGRKRRAPAILSKDPGRQGPSLPTTGDLGEMQVACTMARSPTEQRLWGAEWSETTHRGGFTTTLVWVGSGLLRACESIW